jgi:hypothetical protein
VAGLKVLDVDVSSDVGVGPHWYAGRGERYGAKLSVTPPEFPRATDRFIS